MSSHSDFTVIGRGDPLIETAKVSLFCPREYRTSLTSKPQYREAVRIWSKMISKTSDVDPKARGIKSSTGYLIYLNYDEKALQKMLQRAKTCGRLKLDE